MWFDRWQASCNDVGVTYNAIGNPLFDGVRTYTRGAGRQLRHISMLTGEEHGFRVNNGVHEASNTLLRIVHDEANSKLKAKLLRDGRGIADECAASAFVWTKAGFTGTITAEYAFTTAPTREIDFEYDHNGLRTQKKVVENGITTIYDYTFHGKW